MKSVLRMPDNIKFEGNTTRPGDKKWDEFRDLNTGQSSMNIHELKSLNNPRCDHYYELLDPNGNIKCRDCPMGTRIVWGLHFLEDGRIIEAKK